MQQLQCFTSPPHLLFPLLYLATRHSHLSPCCPASNPVDPLHPSRPPSHSHLPLLPPSPPSLSSLQDSSFSRAYAAYGGIFILLALMWGWAIDRTPPDKWDLIGSAIAVAGACIIMFVPRAAAAAQAHLPAGSPSSSQLSLVALQPFDVGPSDVGVGALPAGIAASLMAGAGATRPP